MSHLDHWQRGNLLSIVVTVAGSVCTILFRGFDSSALRAPLPRIQILVDLVQFGLESVAGSAEFGNCLFGQKLLQGPFLDVLGLILLELSYELDCTLEDASFVFLTARYDFGKLVDTFVDCFATATFDCEKKRVLDNVERMELWKHSPSLWLSLRTLCHSSVPTAGLLADGVAEGDSSEVPITGG